MRRAGQRPNPGKLGNLQAFIKIAIEQFLMRHPKIADAQVIGIPDAFMGEEMATFIWWYCKLRSLLLQSAWQAVPQKSRPLRKLHRSAPYVRSGYCPF
jgi:hypothetical protein